MIGKNTTQSVTSGRFEAHHRFESTVCRFLVTSAAFFLVAGGAHMLLEPAPPQAPITDISTSNRDTVLKQYMATLTKQIKSHWHPPRKNESQEVVCQFRVYKSGEVGNLRVVKSSGLKDMDWSARQAIEKAVPFETIPTEDNSLEIEYTFAYNVHKHLGGLQGGTDSFGTGSNEPASSELKNEKFGSMPLPPSTE